MWAAKIAQKAKDLSIRPDNIIQSLGFTRWKENQLPKVVLDLHHVPCGTLLHIRQTNQPKKNHEHFPCSYCPSELCVICSIF